MNKPNIEIKESFGRKVYQEAEINGRVYDVDDLTQIIFNLTYALIKSTEAFETFYGLEKEIVAEEHQGEFIAVAKIVEANKKALKEAGCAE